MLWCRGNSRHQELRPKLTRMGSNPPERPGPRSRLTMEEASTPREKRRAFDLPPQGVKDALEVGRLKLYTHDAGDIAEQLNASLGEQDNILPTVLRLEEAQFVDYVLSCPHRVIFLLVVLR